MSDRIACLFASLIALLSETEFVSAQNSHETIRGSVRTALVIGIETYSKYKKLNNPANDARDVGASLTNLHFHPQVHTDDNAENLRKHIQDWTKSIPRNCDIALFYFAGHGLQDKGENYLFPTDGNDISDVILNRTTYKVSDILNQMKASGAKLNILILDACRLPPPPRTIKMGKFEKGLAAMNPTGNGTLICFSTEANKSSSDGPAGGHSEYTQALLEFLEVPGLPVLKMFERVHDRVFYVKELDQNPCIYSSVGEDFDFCFTPIDRTTKPDLNSEIPLQNEAPLLRGISPASDKDSLFRAAVDSVAAFVNKERNKVCGQLSSNITMTDGGSNADIDNYIYMNHYALNVKLSTTRVIVARVDLSVEGINFKFKLSSANKDWGQPENNLLSQYEFLHNLDSVYTRQYSIYSIQWRDLRDLITNYYDKRLPVLQKNGVLESPRQTIETDTFTTNKISQFKSAANSPTKLKDESDRKIFNALYQTIRSVATEIKDSLGKNFEYHEDDVYKDYKTHTFYFGIGVRSVDISNKWIVPIFSGGIRNDSLCFQIATYSNPELLAWEKENHLTHDESVQVPLTEVNWADVARRTRKFIASRLEILK